MVSKLAQDTFDVLKKVFDNGIEKEYYTNYKGKRLFYDFFIKKLCSNGLLIECQGKQHFEFNKFHYNTKDDFYAQKRRDNLKVEYSEENNIPLVYFYYDDKITEDLILSRIYEAMG